MPAFIITKRLLFVLSIVLFILFTIFSFFVAKEKFTQHDFDLTVKIQDKLPRSVDFPFSTLSVLGSAELTGLIWLTIVVYFFLRKFYLASFMQILLPIGLVIEILGKVFLHHPSPPYLFFRGVIDFNFPSHFVHTEYSYPSGHMFRTAFICTLLITYILIRSKNFIHKSVITLGLSLLMILMAVSRVYLGEHWTSDVIGGLLLGNSLGIIAAIFVPYKKTKEKLITEE